MLGTRPDMRLSVHGQDIEPSGKEGAEGRELGEDAIEEGQPLMYMRIHIG